VADTPETDFPPKLSKPAQRALAGAGYRRLEQLTQVRESDLARLHGMGPKALRQLREALAERGESFAENTRR
jgi:DNA-directed RNA polymerase alpha subunit